MSTNVVMPQMGESVTEGTITSWFKQPGDWVDKDDSLLLITTDKVDAEVPSPASGYLQKVLFPEGETVEIDTVIAVLSADKSDASDGPAEAPKAAPEPSKDAEQDAPESQKPAPALAAVGSSANSGGTVTELRRSRSSPLVRRMAEEHNVDINAISGTGISGRVTKKDFLNYLENKPAAPASRPGCGCGSSYSRRRTLRLPTGRLRSYRAFHSHAKVHRRPHGDLPRHFRPCDHGLRNRHDPGRQAAGLS